MTTAHRTIFQVSPTASGSGVRLHRFTVDEYDRMAEHGVFGKNDPIELLDGRLAIKLDDGPPYGVPLGIPPSEFVGQTAEAFPQRRFTVAEYHKLLESQALHPALRTELVEGWVVEKMTRNARHDSTVQRASEALGKRIGKKWKLRLQSAVTMDDGEPEPDIAVVPGPVGRFDDEHPRPSEVELLIEISDTTLRYDRGSKLRDYARNGIRRYLILNLVHNQIEEYQDPSGPTDQPKYGSRHIYKHDDEVVLELGGKRLKPIRVDEFIRPLPQR